MTSYPEPPAWAYQAARLVDRLHRAGVRIRALKLTDEQYDEAERYLRAYDLRFTHLFGYPVRRAS